MSKIKKKLIILDLDGVLINSRSNMKTALNLTAEKLKIKLPFNIYKKFLGLPFEKILYKMNIKKDFKKIKLNYEKFSFRFIKKIKIEKKKIKDLRNLSKLFYIAVFTSKSKLRTNAILHKYNFFDYCITADDVKFGKPNPEGLNKIKKQFKLNSKDCIFIGDSIYDYKASKASKILYLHAKWGYEQNYYPKKIKTIKNLFEIKKFLI